MGVVNVTPDSFSDGGQFQQASDAVAHALALADQGADVLDIGGESSRPGAEDVSTETEIARVIPVIEGVRAAGCRSAISIDTRKAAVARAALAAGADWVNDISALRFDPAMAPLLAEAGCPAILMHMRGNPRDMQQRTHYEDVIGDVLTELAAALDAAEAAGIARDRLLVDPGIGFAKTPEQNLVLLRHVERFHALGRPLVVGVSRKSVIGQVLDLPVSERLEGALSVTALLVAAGVQVIRVHDVQANVRAARMADAIVRAQA